MIWYISFIGLIISLFIFIVFHNSSVPILSRAIFFLATFEMRMSMGLFVSYKDGAWSMIIAVPSTQASVKIHRNNLSSTMATYFQSSST